MRHEQNRNLILVTAFFMIMIFAFSKTHAQNTVPPASVTSCTACHGPMGKSMNPLWPNLAGQKKDYLVKQLKDFRSGNRKDPLMSPVAQTINEADIENIAIYFSSQTTGN